MMIINLESDRLFLRPFKINDATRVQELAGNKEVAETTLGIPHPYPIEAAKNWITHHPILIENGTFPLAIILKGEDLLIGTMTIRVEKEHRKGELAYWIGKDYWGNGYATEAAKEVVRFGFDVLKLNRIWAKAMSKNTPSTSLMQKIGMKKEGTLKQDIFKSEAHEDVDIYGIIKSEWFR